MSVSVYEGYPLERASQPLGLAAVAFTNAGYRVFGEVDMHLSGRFGYLVEGISVSIPGMPDSRIVAGFESDGRVSLCLRCTEKEWHREIVEHTPDEVLHIACDLLAELRAALQ